MKHVPKSINRRFVFLALTGTLAVPFSAEAHDPKEHLKDAESPNCAAMRNMEHGKMDANDPVMQAMVKQCMDELHHDDEHGDASGHGDPTEAEDSSDRHSDHQL